MAGFCSPGGSGDVQGRCRCPSCGGCGEAYWPCELLGVGRGELDCRSKTADGSVIAAEGALWCLHHCTDREQATNSGICQGRKLYTSAVDSTFGVPREGHQPTAAVSPRSVVDVVSS